VGQFEIGEFDGIDAAVQTSVMPERSSKRPRDINALAKRIVDEAVGDAPKTTKDPLAVELGRRGGLKGGKARADSLSPERRVEIARRAAAARWGDKPS
jgi:hypothetical protein